MLNVEEYPNIKFDNIGWDTIAMTPKQLFEINKKFSPSVNTNIEKESVFNSTWPLTFSLLNNLLVLLMAWTNPWYHNDLSKNKVFVIGESYPVSNIETTINISIVLFCHQQILLKC